MLQLDFYNFIFIFLAGFSVGSVWTFADDTLFSLAKNLNRPVPF